MVLEISFVNLCMDKELNCSIRFLLRIALEMPPRVDSCPWVLKFTTTTDGFALNTMTRKLSSVTGPVLILIEVRSNIYSSIYKFLRHFEGTT